MIEIVKKNHNKDTNFIFLKYNLSTLINKKLV